MRFTSLLGRLASQSAIAIGIVMLGVVLLAFSGRQNMTDVLKVGGAALFAAGLSMLIGTISSRGGVRWQYAKDARLLAKKESYSPLHVELKALRRCLDQAKAGAAEYPSAIKLSDTEPAVVRSAYLPIVPDLDFMWWEQFKQDTHEDDFTPRTAEVLDSIVRCAREYNAAVSAARDATIPILATHIRAARSELQAAKDPDGRVPWLEFVANYRDRQQRPAMSSEPPLANSWYAALLDDDSPTTLTVASITLIISTSANRPQTLGWLLARQTEKAAEAVLASHSKEAPFSTAPQQWVQACLDAALPVLEAHPSYQAVWSTFTALLKPVHTADAIILKALRDIREQYKGVPLA